MYPSGLTPSAGGGLYSPPSMSESSLAVRFLEDLDMLRVEELVQVLLGCSAYRAVLFDMANCATTVRSNCARAAALLSLY